MCNTMKTLLFLLAFLIICSNVNAQVVKDASVKDSFTTVFHRLDKVTQAKLLKLEQEGQPAGMVILSQYESDTLNKATLKKLDFEGITLTPIDPETNQPIKQEPKSEVQENPYTVIFCGSILLNDTLSMDLGAPFASQSLKHIVYKGSVRTTYNEYLKYDSILKAGIQLPHTNDLTIDVKTVQFKVNDTAFNSGKTIYGIAEVVTEPYYKRNMWEENEFYKIQWRMKYYFSCPIYKNP